MKKIRNIAAAALALVALPAAAGTITDVKVIPNPAVISGTNAPAQVNVQVHVNLGAIPRNCEVIITPGDGTNVPRMMFGMNTANQTAHLRYTKPGNYKITVAGFGSQGCDGSRTIALTVTERSASGGGAAPAAATTAAAANMPACPAGWQASANAVSGARLACVVRPVPLTCPQGTTYFSQQGVIGCR
jgi:hypothetical protein